MEEVFFLVMLFIKVRILIEFLVIISKMNGMIGCLYIWSFLVG